MSTLPGSRSIVLVPFLHCSSLKDRPKAVVCLNAGCVPEKRLQNYYTPALPLSKEAAALWLQEAAAYTDLFSRPGELAAAFLQAKDGFYANTSQAIAHELRSFGGEKRHAQDFAKKVYAQQVLLLALKREEMLAEVSGLDAYVEKAFWDLRQNLGLEADATQGYATNPAQMETMPKLAVEPYSHKQQWLPVFQAILTLVPPDVILYTDHKGMIASWQEAGLCFEEPGSLPFTSKEELWMLEAGGGKLLGEKKAGQQLTHVRRVLIPKAFVC